MRNGQQEDLGPGACQSQHLLLCLLERSEDPIRARIAVAAKLGVTINSSNRLIVRTADRDRHGDDERPLILQRIEFLARCPDEGRVARADDADVGRAVVHDHHRGIGRGREALELLRGEAAVGAHGHMHRDEAQASGQSSHELALSRIRIRSKPHGQVEKLLHSGPFG